MLFSKGETSNSDSNTIIMKYPKNLTHCTLYILSTWICLWSYSISAAATNLTEEPIYSERTLIKDLEIDIDGISKMHWKESGLEGQSFDIVLQVTGGGKTEKVMIPEALAESILGPRLIKGLSTARFEPIDTSEGTDKSLVRFTVLLEYPTIKSPHFGSWWVDAAEQRWSRQIARSEERDRREEIRETIRSNNEAD
jgi:hypothetical protein